MSTFGLVVIVVVAVLVVLALGGAVANARRRGDTHAGVDEANRALAAAHAQDKGWEPDALEAAARRAFEAERPGVAIREQALVQVVDRPGTDQDRAVFRFVTDDGERLLTLGRSAGRWVTQAVE